MNYTHAIRAYLEENPEGRLADLYAEFNEIGVKKLNVVLTRLEKSGALRLPDPTYQYDVSTPPKREKKQTAMWRAIRNLAKKQRIIDPKDVQRLAGVSVSYFRRYLSFLENQGYVERRKTGLAVFEKAMRRPDPPFLRPSRAGEKK